MAHNNGNKRGLNLTGEPIRKQKDIRSISRLLKSNPRIYFFWVMGINKGIRRNDLVSIRYHQVEGLKAGFAIKIIESKTRKTNVLVINKSVHKALQVYVKEINPGLDDYLFYSKKGKN